MNRKRAGLMTAAVFLGILLLIAAAAAILRGFGGRRVRNDDAPYPYEWTEKRDGSVTLTLDGSAAKESRWIADGADTDVAAVALGETKRGRASARLTPASQGRAELTFALLEGDRRLAELRLAVETAEKDGRLGVAVLSHSEWAGQEAVSGGKEEHPYTVYTDDAGYLVLRVADGGAPAEDGPGLTERWSAESSDELIAAVAELRAAEGGVEVRLTSHVNGVAEVTVSGAEANVTYRFTVASDGGALRLRDCAWTDYAPVTEEEMNGLLSGVADSLRELKEEKET